jgi:hypothetical protein
MRNTAKSSNRMASASLAGVAVLLGLTQGLRAEVSYHLVLLPDEAKQITNAGIVLLSDRTLLEPARDAQGNPVWDSDGDGVADGYTARVLTTGDYSGAHATRVNEELGLAAGAGDDPDGVSEQAVLWTNIWTANEDGTFGTLVDLGQSHTAQYGTAMDVNSRGQVVVRQYCREVPPPRSFWARAGAGQSPRH